MRNTSILILLVLGGALLPAQNVSHKPTVAQQAAAQASPQVVPQATNGVVTLDQLQKRLKDLQDGLTKAGEQAQQAEANVHAFQGAIQETQNWINTLTLKFNASPPTK